MARAAENLRLLWAGLRLQRFLFMIQALILDGSMGEYIFFLISCACVWPWMRLTFPRGRCICQLAHQAPSMRDRGVTVRSLHAPPVRCLLIARLMLNETVRVFLQHWCRD